MYFIESKNMTYSDWSSLYNKKVILDADCSLFPEFNNIKCTIKNIKRSKTNSSLYIIEVETVRKGRVKRISADSGMNGLVVTVLD